MDAVSNPRQGKNHTKPPKRKLKQILFYVLLLALGVLFVAGIFALKQTANNLSATESPSPLQFYTTGIFSLFVLTAIVVQIIVNFFQWRAAQDQTDIAKQALAPRLRITDVDLLGMEIGGTPFFTIWLDNEGAVDAVDVAVYMRVEGVASLNWNREQIVTIAAREKRCFFVKWGTTLNQDSIDRINAASGSVTIKGYIRHNSETRKFCYSYYALGNLTRPKGIPRFLPCDFTPGLNITMIAEAGSFEMTGSSVGLTHRNIDDIEAIVVIEDFPGRESISFDIKETDTREGEEFPEKPN